MTRVHAAIDDGVVAAPFSSYGDDSLIQALREKRGKDFEDCWRQTFGFGYDSLTRSEARHLENSPDAHTIRDRLIAARPENRALPSNAASGPLISSEPRRLRYATQEVSSPSRTDTHCELSPRRAPGAAVTWDVACLRRPSAYRGAARREGLQTVSVRAHYDWIVRNLARGKEILGGESGGKSGDSRGF
jgi:hypothetical protein